MFKFLVSSSIAIALLSFSCGTAQAKGLRSFKNTAELQRFVSQLHASPTKSFDDSKPAPVLRKIRAKGVITKYWMEKVGNRHEEQSKKVCEFDRMFNFYDLRDDDSSISLEDDILSCSSTVGNTPVKVSVMLYSGLINVDLDSIEPGEVKLFSPNLFLDFERNRDAPKAQDNVWSMTATREQSVSNLITALFPSITRRCSTDSQGNQTCDQNYPEYFDAFVEIEDKQ